MNEITVEKPSTRNGLIEFLRFLFALWIVHCHDYLPVTTRYFSVGKIAVEFFFILSGFFMLKSFEKQSQHSIAKGGWSLVVRLFKSLGMAFVIGAIFSGWYAIVSEYEGLTIEFINYNFLGYLWYVYRLAIVTVIFFVLYRWLKNKVVFFILMGIVFVTCACLYFFDNGILRALGGISLGILLSKIPQINTSNAKLTLALKIIGMTVSFCGCLVVASLPEKDLLTLSMLYIFGFSSLLYFANQLRVDCKFLRFLGSLSFGLYSYQCVLRVIEFYGLTNVKVLVVLLVTMALIDRRKEFFDLFKKEKKQITVENQ